MENDNKYETWDLEIPEISPRNILYDLPPIGIGTREVESLSGYISRLAQEHRLSPIILLKNSVQDLSELPKSILQNSISTALAGGINGFGESTKIITDILQKATRRKDILFTSLMQWKYKLSNHKLLKKNLAWCDLCFNEQKETGTVYEKLIWSLYSTNACHIHELPLVEKCPHCNKKLKVLSGKSRPGFCSACRCWLGSNLVRFDEFRNFRDDEEKKKEIWKVIRAGEFLSETPFSFAGLNEIENNERYFPQNLLRQIETLSHGSINDFSHKTGTWHVTVRRLLAGEVLPTMEIILKVSVSLEISPVELFDSYDCISVQNKTHAASQKQFSKEELITRLKVYLEEHPPPSANEVSRRTGWTTTRLQRHFPAEYRMIVDQYLNYVKQKIPDLTEKEIESVLTKASKEHPPPSLQSVFRKIGCTNTGYRYYQKFPKQCRKIADRYKKSKLKKFNVAESEKIMRAALEENPSPSFSEVARRVGCTRENLRNKLPDLSADIDRRYKNYLFFSRKENLTHLEEEIRNAFIRLENENAVISMNKVKEMLPRKWNDKNFKNAYRIISEEWNLKKNDLILAFFK